MPNNHKFKKDDIVYVKVPFCSQFEVGKIFSYDEKENAYIMILFWDYDPKSFRGWCYVKEEDIDFVSKNDDIPDYIFEGLKEDMCVIPKLTPSNFIELYNEVCEAFKKLNEAKIYYEECQKEVNEVLDRRYKNNFKLKKRKNKA